MLSQEMMEKGDDEGLCFDGLEVALGCTVGDSWDFHPDCCFLGGHWLWGQAEHGLDDLHGG